MNIGNERTITSSFTYGGYVLLRPRLNLYTSSRSGHHTLSFEWLIFLLTVDVS